MTREIFFRRLVRESGHTLATRMDNTPCFPVTRYMLDQEGYECPEDATEEEFYEKAREYAHDWAMWYNWVDWEDMDISELMQDEETTHMNLSLRQEDGTEYVWIDLEPYQGHVQ